MTYARIPASTMKIARGMSKQQGSPIWRRVGYCSAGVVWWADVLVTVDLGLRNQGG